MDFDYFEQYNLGIQYIARYSYRFTTPPGTIDNSSWNKQYISIDRKIKTMAYFSYMRISTKEERQKQKYARQQKALEQYARENNIIYSVSYMEDESGKSFENRKEWQKLEALARE